MNYPLMTHKNNKVQYVILWILILAILLTLLNNSHANNEQWRLQRHQDNITIYQQATPSGYAITQGTINIATSLDALLTLMRDQSSCQRWVHACKIGQLITQYNAEQRLDYVVIDSPLWFADRDMYIHSTIQINTVNKTIKIQLSGREQHDKKQAGRVRIKALKGFWRLQQQKENEVNVTYQIYNNPQLMASTLLDAYMVDSVFHTLNNLRRVLQKTQEKH